ncbi:PLP-dependent aminotransferase family protein [Leifsonia sp. SIMBA_070]|uniref:aminotransferase-like domain-containing protein n=1 Tax=Leifsonia sp. SIMBA_070 TaxID=3085810 RepID=UPI00397E5330
MEDRAARLSGMLGPWRRGRGRLHLRLADAITRLIELGALPGGSTLPSERSLAAVLDISRTTVTAAYDELRGHGWITTRRGALPRVGLSRPDLNGPLLEERVEDVFRQQSHDVIDLETSSPLAAPAVEEMFRRPLGGGAATADLTGGGGYAVDGLPALRDAIVRRLRADGIPAQPAEIVITNGAQQAISLIASALVSPRRPSAIEELSYPGAISVLLRQSRAGLVALPADDSGLRVEEAVDVIRSVKPRIAYVSTYHNPTGAALSAEGASALIEAALEAGTTLVEDRTLADLRLSGGTAPALASLAPPGSVVTIGSMSKLYWAGMRVGWIHGRAALVQHLREQRAAHDLGGSPPMQAIAAALLVRHHEDTVAWRRRQIRISLESARTAIEESGLPWVFREPRGGLSLWVRTPAHADLLARLGRHVGVAVLPGTSCSVTTTRARHAIRISLAADPDRIADGIRRIARLREAHNPAT